MSKAEVLRGFVTERLAAASEEILAVVDRIVADYEEEASGFRQQIDRQRSQLELLQAQDTLNTAGVKGFDPVEEEEDEEDEEDESCEHPEKLEDSTKRPSSRSFPPRCENTKRKAGRAQTSETQNHVDLRIRILEDSRTNVLSNKVLKKCPMRKLKCPRGLQEADFLDLLRCTFPQLTGENKSFVIFTSDKRRRLQALRVKTLTAEEIHRNVSGAGWKSTLYIRLQTHKDPETSEEENNPPQTNSGDGPCDESRPQTSPVQEVEGSREDVLSSSSTSQQQHMETEEAGDEDRGISEPAERKGDGGEDIEKEEANVSCDSWKPDMESSELQSKRTKKEKAQRSGVKAENCADDLSCKVCGALHTLEIAAIKHAWSHVDTTGSLCGVCGELSESVEALKDHLQSHHKTDDCHICGESFLDMLSLNEHVAAHSGERSYKCDVCHDAFALKVTLENHQKLHKAGKLNKCYTCHKVFTLKEQLKAHRRTHSNKKTHLCGVCGKALSDYRSLSRHKMTHSGERPHSCHVCGRRFKLPGTLRQHEKIHTDRERSYLCDVCCKMFLTSKQLQIHMRTHTNEKPYHCGECGKGFTTKGPLTIHMRVHTGETPYRCPDCGWSFKRKINLDNHVTVHSGLKPFVCGTCGKACARKTYLTVHMRTHNGERPYKCTLCDKAFTQSHCLKTHMKSHQGEEAAT
ncbi:zinc finger protein 665-like isoform X2 [Cottoperca gobio]|uniref:Zinc finger protein 665-like isoform X2 n=1 Tax=Cottoperca gobio TaxID=56716 RepID=A0A6J2PDH8_COTGO|nr:zinc finger protein 665-like isoform X2 [Cottoperca gobio]